MKYKQYNKRLLLFLVCSCFYALYAAAQEVTVNNLAILKPGSNINLEIDFSQCSIMGMTENDFSKYERDWFKDKPVIIVKFQKGINSKLDGILNVGSFSNSPYFLKVTVKSISEVGNLFCDAVMTDKSGKVLFRVKNVNGGNEPPFLPGTKLAKIKIWANLTGRALGSIIKSEYLDQ